MNIYIPAHTLPWYWLPNRSLISQGTLFADEACETDRLKNGKLLELKTRQKFLCIVCSHFASCNLPTLAVCAWGASVSVCRLGLGGLCSIFHPLCYSNMLEIIPIMLETMPQICLLCSNYAHNFWKEQMLFTLYRKVNKTAWQFIDHWTATS